MKNSVLPDGYEIPNPPSKYMKLLKGANKFRMLSTPIVGNEYWVTETKEGGEERRVPKRKRNGEQILVRDLEEDSVVKPFWAFVVWNYTQEAVQILELTQKTIMRTMKSYFEEDDWGNPIGKDGYDFVITRKGEGYDTEYGVIANPKKQLDKETVEIFESMKINLEALFDGEDPFEAGNEEEVKPEDIKI